jgi:ABC-type multidrug transport system fused ATPase/permease subunit
MIKKIKLAIDFVGPNVARNFSLLMLLGVFYFSIETGFVYALQLFLVTLGVMHPSNLAFKIDISSEYFIIFALIILGACKAGCHYIRIFLATTTQQHFLASQRKIIFERSLKADDLQFSNSEILSLFSDVVTQSGLVIYYLCHLSVTGVATLCLFSYGLYIAPKEMIVAALTLALLIIPLRILHRKIHEYGRSILKEWGQTNHFLMTGLRNNFYLKLSGTIQSQVNLGSNSLESYRIQYRSFSKIQSMLSSLPLFLGILVVALVTYVSLDYFKTPGIVLLSFFYLFLRMSQMASEALNTLSQLKLNSQYFKKLYTFNNTVFINHSHEANNPNLSLASNLNDIKMEEISFQFQENKPLFSNLNLSLKRNDVLVITGESGTGKSTLLSILLGLKNPSKGQISFNQKYKKISPEIIAYVGPEPYLIPGTIRENILFANNAAQSITDEQIWTAIKSVKLFDVIHSLPQKLDEKLSDNIILSTGQKQRLAIVRAFLRNAELYILDEATANLDSETEEIVLRQFKEKFKNSIAIIVTHKNSFQNLATNTLHLK